MRGTANVKNKVVTSGRLTGGVRVQRTSRRVSPHPGPAARPEPTYSLYSTDSEDQVSSLHKGLDRCAALLSGILQADSAEAMPGPPRALKGGAAKSRPSTSLGKKTIKKQPPKTDHKSCQSVQRGPGSTTHQPAAPAAPSQVKLHSTLQQCHCPPSASRTLQSPHPTSTPPPQPHTSTPPLQCETSTPPPRPHTSTPPPQPPPHSGQLSVPQTDGQAAHTACKVECDREEEEFVPVRDINTHNTAVRHTHSHIHTCTLKMSNMQLEPGQVDRVHEDTHSGEDCSAETEGKLKTAQYLLGELKALIAGQDSVAERLLSHLEQTVTSSLMNAGSSNIQTEPDLSSLHSQNTQLCRHVKILNQQLKEREKAERQQNMETLCNSEVSALQEELTMAQSRLQELQDDLTQLRKALEDTQSRLTHREAETALIQTDLEATRSKLLDSEREKSELASLAQQRLEQIGNLNRILQSQESSHRPAVVDSSVSHTQQHRQNPAEPLTERISHFLLSVGQLEPTHTEHVCAAAEGEGSTREQKKLSSVQLRDSLLPPDVRCQRGHTPAETSVCHQNSPLHQSHGSHEVQSRGWWLEKERRRLSQCDLESACSDWSMRSGWSFTSRDEAAFRDGLAALDASIASLHKTIQLELRR